MMKHTRIVTVEELLPIVTRRRARGDRVVLTNGCFDLLHVGHIRYLQAARGLGDLLIVGVNSDASMQTLNKGTGRPFIPENQRVEVLSALSCVDYVVKFAEPDPLCLIDAIQPDVLVKGGDWPVEAIVGRDKVEARGGLVVSVPLVPEISTSVIIERIQNFGSTKEGPDAVPPSPSGTPLTP